MLVVAVPGQGAQAPGFLTPWLELPGVAERLAAWSELAGCDLIRCGTTASADEIKDTAVAQPLIVASALAVSELLAPGQGLSGTVPPDSGGHDGLVAAGHSVGELAAGVIAGILRAEDAMRLVRVRGQAMARAAAAEATSMTAVLGGDQDAVLAAIAAHGLTPANINGAGQIVAAGTAEQLAAFAADPPARARLRSLQVAGAFHTEHMAQAVDALREAAAGVQVRDPVLPILSNADGAVVSSGTEWLQRIVTQVSTPVRWDLCMQAMASMGAAALIELPPAGPLSGLAQRALRGIKLRTVRKPEDLAPARELLAEHADSHFDGHSDCHAPDWRLLVAPLGGTFRSPAVAGGGEPAAPGAAVGSGAELGRVEMRSGSHPLTAEFPATIIEWLVEDGDPVSAGQPLIRLQPVVPD